MIDPIVILLAIAASASEHQLPALEAFDQLCGESETVADVQREALELGWAVHSPEEGSEHARLAAELSRTPSNEFELDLRVFQSGSGDLTAFALDLKSPSGEAVLECKVNDDSIVRPTEGELLEWAGREPSKRRGSGSAEVLEWAPSHLPAPRSVMVYHVPLASEPEWPGKGLMVTSLRYYEIN